jgi:hypothetical protein
MHLHDLPKERVPIAPRTWKEPSSQFAVFSFLFSMHQLLFLNAVSV